MDKVQIIGEYLNNPKNPLKGRFRALFYLKNINSKEAVVAIANCFSDDSVLLKHELAYCLGQMKNKEAIPILIDLLEDKRNDVIVRHEAGEALGAIGTEDCLEACKKYVNDSAQEVAETCQLAVKRIQMKNDIENGQIKPIPQSKEYSTTDPAYPLVSETKIESLSDILKNEKCDLYTRYSAMFKLRDINTSESANAISTGFNCKDSALFRHEIAFVLGQMQDPITVESLYERLADTTESPMVRHESAEALGAIGQTSCMNYLSKYLNDPERIVRESCEVALDICEYEMNDEFQYADDEQIIKNCINP